MATANRISITCDCSVCNGAAATIPGSWADTVNVTTKAGKLTSRARTERHNYVQLSKSPLGRINGTILPVTA